MFSIFEQIREDGIQPPVSAAGMNRQQMETDNQKQLTEASLQSQSQGGIQQTQPRGCTRFCQLAFYRPYFNVSQNQIVTRIKQAIMFPPSDQLLSRAKVNPDFYGPFWIITTLVILLGAVGNISNYLLSIVNWEKSGDYFFRLEYLRYAFSFLYSYCLLVPTSAFIYFKFAGGKNNIGFPEMMCLYGYSLCSYLPALVVCIIPMQLFHLIALIYAFISSSWFLHLNLKSQIQGVQVNLISIAIGSIQFILSLILKIYFLPLMSNQ